MSAQSQLIASSMTLPIAAATVIAHSTVTPNRVAVGHLPAIVSPAAVVAATAPARTLAYVPALTAKQRWRRRKSRASPDVTTAARPYLAAP